MLPESGKITMLDIIEEIDGERIPRKICLGDEDVRELADIPSGPIKISDLYGKTADAYSICMWPEYSKTYVPTSKIISNLNTSNQFISADGNRMISVKRITDVSLPYEVIMVYDYDPMMKKWIHSHSINLDYHYQETMAQISGDGRTIVATLNASKGLSIDYRSKVFHYDDARKLFISHTTGYPKIPHNSRLFKLNYDGTKVFGIYRSNTTLRYYVAEYNVINEDIQFVTSLIFSGDNIVNSYDFNRFADVSSDGNIVVTSNNVEICMCVRKNNVFQLTNRISFDEIRSQTKLHIYQLYSVKTVANGQRVLVAGYLTSAHRNSNNLIVIEYIYDDATGKYKLNQYFTHPSPTATGHGRIFAVSQNGEYILTGYMDYKPHTEDPEQLETCFHIFKLDKDGKYVFNRNVNNPTINDIYIKSPNAVCISDDGSTIVINDTDNLGYYRNTHGDQNITILTNRKRAIPNFGSTYIPRITNANENTSNFGGEGVAVSADGNIAATLTNNYDLHEFGSYSAVHIFKKIKGISEWKNVQKIEGEHLCSNSGYDQGSFCMSDDGTTIVICNAAGDNDIASTDTHKYNCIHIYKLNSETDKYELDHTIDESGLYGDYANKIGLRCTISSDKKTIAVTCRLLLMGYASFVEGVMLYHLDNNNKFKRIKTLLSGQTDPTDVSNNETFGSAGLKFSEDGTKLALLHNNYDFANSKSRVHIYNLSNINDIQLIGSISNTEVDYNTINAIYSFDITPDFKTIALAYSKSTFTLSNNRIYNGSIHLYKLNIEDHSLTFEKINTIFPLLNSVTSDFGYDCITLNSKGTQIFISSKLRIKPYDYYTKQSIYYENMLEGKRFYDIIGSIQLFTKLENNKWEFTNELLYPHGNDYFYCTGAEFALSKNGNVLAYPIRNANIPHPMLNKNHGILTIAHNLVTPSDLADNISDSIVLDVNNTTEFIVPEGYNYATIYAIGSGGAGGESSAKYAGGAGGGSSAVKTTVQIKAGERMEWHIAARNEYNKFSLQDSITDVKIHSTTQNWYRWIVAYGGNDGRDGSNYGPGKIGTGGKAPESSNFSLTNKYKDGNTSSKGGRAGNIFTSKSSILNYCGKGGLGCAAGMPPKSFNYGGPGYLHITLYKRNPANK